MKFTEFIWQAIVRPAKAFASGRGHFLTLSLLVGVAALFPGNYFLGSGSPVNSIIAGAVVSLAFLIISAAIYHGVVKILYTTEQGFSQFLSIYGFTYLPALITGLTVVGVVGLGLISFRDPTNPSVFSLYDPWFTALVVFGYLMAVARLIYAGLALESVYALGWKRILAVMAISYLVLNLVVSPLAASLMQTTQVSLAAMPLTLEGISQISAPTKSRITIPVREPEWRRGEALVAFLGPCLVRGPIIDPGSPLSSMVEINSDIIVDLMALPGETVAITNGAVMVNGAVAFQPKTPLTHLNLPERILGEREVLVYVRSPEALGSLTGAEQFVINMSDVSGTPRGDVVRLFAWIAR